MTQRKVAGSISRQKNVLPARWVQGEVISVSGSVVTLYLEGNRTQPVDVPKLAQATGLVAGDRVEILQYGRAHLVLGKVG